MIASIDGSTVVDGRSGALGGPGDRAVFATLRRHADVIIVGAATVRAEGYDPPKRAGQRIGVVTASGRVDTTTPLFTSGAGFLVTTEDSPPTRSGIDVVRAGVGAVDLGRAMTRLGDIADPLGFVQAEGGSRLNASLLDAGCVDEVNLTVAPLLVGGDGARLTTDARDAMQALELAHVLGDDDGYVFMRWVRPQPARSA